MPYNLNDSRLSLNSLTSSGSDGSLSISPGQSTPRRSSFGVHPTSRSPTSSFTKGYQHQSSLSTIGSTSVGKLLPDVENFNSCVETMQQTVLCPNRLRDFDTPVETGEKIYSKFRELEVAQRLLAGCELDETPDDTPLIRELRENVSALSQLLKLFSHSAETISQHYEVEVNSQYKTQ